MYCFNDVEVLKNGVITPIKNIPSDASVIKVQSNAGAFSFTVKGKMNERLEFSNITLIRDDGYLVTNTVSDGCGYMGDITGYNYLQIETSGIVDDTSFVEIKVYGDR